jgi:hypothetical protein
VKRVFSLSSGALSTARLVSFDAARDNFHLSIKN